MRIYNINEMAVLLGTTAAAIHAHLKRQNYSAVPQPIHLGRNLAWPEGVVQEWIDAKISSCKQKSLMNNVSQTRSRGRPRKAIS